MDNFAIGNGGGVISGSGMGIRNGCCSKITGFWSFIHSLLSRSVVLLKRIVITGGTGGLGKAIAVEFTNNGWDVVALGRHDLDLADIGSVTRFFENTPCDLLVCCAGMIRDTLLVKMGQQLWDDVVAVNYKAAARCVAAAVPGMLSKGRGHVIFISSYAARHPVGGQAAYAAAKAALHGLTRELAEKYGSDGLRFNVVLPGFLETPMTEVVSAQRKEVIREKHCLGDFNTVSVTAAFIRFLEEQLPFTSGQVFPLDSRL
jgi:3-oxoacyl-[acyl-carrier protein] reductase